MSLLKQLITGFANHTPVLMPKVEGGCYGCRDARALAAMREGVLNDWYWLGHTPALGASWENGRSVLDVQCPQCGSHVLAHIQPDPAGPALWVDDIVLVFGCAPEGQEK